MIHINKYVEVIDSEKIIRSGKYRIGTEIPCGEYYLWGQDIWYSYKRKKEKEYHEYTREVYDIFEKGDILDLEAGKMTLVDNLHYLCDKTDVILPEHIYRVGIEIPEGYYLFKFDKAYYKEPISYCRNEEECAFDMHENYAYSRYHSETKKNGCVLVSSETRHIEVKNGIAIYYGNNKFDEEQIVNDSSINENTFFINGIKIFSCKIMELLLYEKHSDGDRFCGEIPVDVLNYSIYAIGDQLKWMADVKPLSFQNPGSMSVRFIDVSNEENSYIAKINKFAYHYDRAKYINWFHISAELPQYLVGKSVLIELIEYNGKSIREPLKNNISIHRYNSNQDIHEIFKEEFKVLKELLQSFDGINIGYEVEYLEKAPDLINEINSCLQEILETRNIYEKKKGDADKEIIFSVPATYDKKFYCCAKLADTAYRIDANEDSTEYKVIFKGTQIEQIELMSCLLYDGANKEDVLNREYLNDKSYIFFKMNNIQQKINSLNEKYGYSSVVTNSVLVRIIKNINKGLQQRVDDIYSDISREGRVQARWGNEYRLFMLVSKYVSGTHYQYHCDWLGKQSYDVYLEKYKIAIEYQGQQHYEAVSLFGGEDGLKYNQERDWRKKKLSEEHGIRLLEWKYTVPVNEDNVRNLLINNGVKIEMVENTMSLEQGLDNHVIMAPFVIKEKKEKRKTKNTVEKVVKAYIVNYTFEGKLKDKYNTIGDAAQAIGISSTSISKVLRGQRNTAGGFIWKKFSAEEDIPETIDITFDLGLTNAGEVRRVAKIDDEGNILQEYASIVEASKLNNIEYKSIQRQINSAKGWKYV